LTLFCLAGIDARQLEAPNCQTLLQIKLHSQPAVELCVSCSDSTSITSPMR
jgi:sulfur relay (sulfurtransferase) complex TusBCD TusD component (DsrE family)